MNVREELGKFSKAIGNFDSKPSLDTSQGLEFSSRLGWGAIYSQALEVGRANEDMSREYIELSNEALRRLAPIRNSQGISAYVSGYIDNISLRQSLVEDLIGRGLEYVNNRVGEMVEMLRDQNP